MLTLTGIMVLTSLLFVGSALILRVVIRAAERRGMTPPQWSSDAPIVPESDDEWHWHPPAP